MGCGFHLTAPSLTVRCPRVSVRHRNKAACGLVVLQATLPSARRMPTCLTCSYADALADTQNKGFFGGCLLTLQFSAARWWESNTQSAEARLERRSSGLLPLHATLLLMVGGTRVSLSNVLPRYDSARLRRAEQDAARGSRGAPVLSDGRGHAAKVGASANEGL